MLEQKIKLEGQLTEISIPEIFHALSVCKATGVFEWSHGHRGKKVFIHQGKIVFATSNQKEERLGDILLRAGRIRVKDFIEGSKKITEQKRLGQILIEMGSLSKDDIKDGVIEQVREIIYRLFNESEGHYVFHEQAQLPKEVITLSINTVELIMKGTQRITDWNRILQNLSEIDTVFERAAGTEKKIEEAQLTHEEKKVFTLVNGERSVEAICRLLGGNDFETCRTLMAFLCAGLIRRVTDSEIEMAEEKKASDFCDRTAQCYNRLFSYVYRYLGEKVGKLGDKNLSHYLEEIKEDHPVLLQGIFLLPDGTLAAEVLRENFEKIAADKRKQELLAGFKALLSAELAATREALGTTEEAFVASRLKQIIEDLHGTK